MTGALQSTLKHLSGLVACDSRNPPRAIQADGPLFSYLRKHLSGFSFKLQDHEDGCISLLAVRGQTNTLFNFHVDTVPANQQWSMNPLEVQVKDDRAYGLSLIHI